MIISVSDRVENIVGKGEIACTSNFFFSQNVFKRLLSQTRQNVSLFGNGLMDRNLMLDKMDLMDALVDVRQDGFKGFII